MVCSIVKKGLLGAALGAGTLFLVFGTSAPSYIRTAFHKVRQTAKDAVDPQFEIDRARADIANLQPMFQQNIETLARAEVETKNLEREIDVIQANLASEKTTMMTLRDKVKNGDFRLTGRYNVTAEELKAQLANRLDHFNATAGILKEKQDTLKAKQMTIDAANRQLRNIQEQRSTLTARLANIEAKLKMLEATQAKNEFNFDDSALSRAKKTVSDLEERLDIMSRKAQYEGRYGNLDGSSTYVDPARDVVKEVDEAFGQPTSPKSADKSL
jgi:peptidoglycan hydrolase CwlO-like protein